MRRLVLILWSAAEKFNADDGWAIASYIGLTLLTSLFPFLIFVAALAGFLGSAQPSSALNFSAALQRIKTSLRNVESL